jgi:hypothetical protein
MLDALAVEASEPRHLITIHDYAREFALDRDACVRILDESGFMPASGYAVVDFGDIPIELDDAPAAALEEFLRREGGRIVSDGMIGQKMSS